MISLRTTPSAQACYRLLTGSLTLLLTVAIPVLLTLLSVRLVMTPLFLHLEYHRPGFPDDFYGLTLEDRLTYAPYAVDYLLNGEGIAYLADLTFPDGTPLYTERELAHMVDVKVVTRAAFFVLLFGSIAISLLSVMVLRRSRLRPAYWQGVLNGGLFTIIALVVTVLGAALFWDTFFTGFHELFFADGTWVFLYSDTLIRLFPEQFWFDAAVVIGILTTLGAALLAALAWRQLHRAA